MTVAKPFAITSSAAIPVAWRSRARVEKIHLSNGLDGERHDAPQQDGFAAAKLARTQLCRNETIDIAPVWEEQRLVPAFVAQLLAQVMNGGAAPADSASRAYRNSAPQIARLYDRET
jgi:hypothetical protein